MRVEEVEVYQTKRNSKHVSAVNHVINVAYAICEILFEWSGQITDLSYGAGGEWMQQCKKHTPIVLDASEELDLRLNFQFLEKKICLIYRLI